MNFPLKSSRRNYLLLPLAAVIVLTLSQISAHDAYAVPVWSASGPGTVATTVPDQGNNGTARFTYLYINPSGDGVPTQTWTFETTATQTGPLTLDYTWTGFHAFFQVTTFLNKVDSAGTTNLISQGPVDCCTSPSGGFSYSGTVTINAVAGQKYGFTLGGSNYDSNSKLLGTFTVKIPPTTTAIVSSSNPSTYGQPVTFTAKVSPTPSAGDTVTFYDASANIGTGTTNSTGQATFATSALSVGSHSITAAFAGDTNFAASTSSPLVQVVNKITTSTALSSSSSTVNYGKSVLFTATVSPAVPNGETITFLNGSAPIGTGTTSGSIATLNDTLSPGTYAITASYPGDANDQASVSSPLTITVLTLQQEKESVVTSLQSLTVADHDDKQDLAHAIDAVQRSANSTLWQSDGIHLVVKTGHRVFDYEKQAADRLNDIIKEKRESSSVVNTLMGDISTLTGVDQNLASVAISDANTASNGYTGNNTKDVKQDIAQAQKEMVAASDEIGRGQFSAGIEHYGHAWAHAEDAVADTTQNGHHDHEDNDGHHEDSDGNHSHGTQTGNDNDGNDHSSPDGHGGH